MARSGGQGVEARDDDVLDPPGEVVRQHRARGIEATIDDERRELGRDERRAAGARCDRVQEVVGDGPVGAEARRERRARDGDERSGGERRERDLHGGRRERERDAARDEDEQRQLRRDAGDGVERGAGRRIEPLRVVEHHDERCAVRNGAQELDDERGARRLGLGRLEARGRVLGTHVDPDDRREQLPAAAAGGRTDDLRRGGGERCRVGVAGEAEQLAQRRPPCGVVDGARLRGARPPVDHVRAAPSCGGRSSGDKRRAATARRGRDDDRAPAAAPCRRGQAGEARELRLTPDEARRRRRRRQRALARRDEEPARGDGSRPPAQPQPPRRAEPRGAGRRAVGDERLARGGARGEPRRDVHDIADRRVRPALRRAGRAAPRDPGGDAAREPERAQRGGARERARGVVLARDRSAERDERVQRARSDLDVEERAAALRGRGRDRLRRRAHRPGVARVDAGGAREEGRHAAVLGEPGASRDDEPLRDRRLDVRARGRLCRASGPDALDGCDPRAPRRWRRRPARPGDATDRRRSLRRIGRHERVARRHDADAVASSARDEREPPGCDADADGEVPVRRDPLREPDEATADRERARPGIDPRQRRHERVHRVSREAEHPAAARAHGAHHRRPEAVERRGDGLGTAAPARGAGLGERREAAHVEHDGGACVLADGARVPRAGVGEERVRDRVGERRQPVGRHGRAARAPRQCSTPAAPVPSAGSRASSWASSVRERMPSLRKMRPRWNSIVFWLRKRRAAASRFVMPSAITVAIWSSCGVSSSSAPASRRRTTSPVARSSDSARCAHGAAPRPSNASWASRSSARASTRRAARRKRSA